MKLLSLETSAKCASCAVTDNGRVLASAFVNTAQTHSQTLMPMVTETLSVAGVSVAQLDGIAVAAGPGSFTGVRIGVAAAKGLAFAQDLPCVGVSSLETVAAQFDGVLQAGKLCVLMDARCGQVYTATFAVTPDGLVQETPDEAIAAADVLARLATCDEPVTLAGDGAALWFAPWQAQLPQLRLAPDSCRYPTAVGVALAAEKAFAAGKAVTAAALQPLYLRLPQAERERLAREGK
ncbi:MAG: tRNA (adenosine(37)-N6)-threonylcarbamoyltransferase complex dimerization subunit type 1 TsaB [Clostridia bacterium]|nr:tRNA (adenosine(37)-N6)-threonylcarbamoyltransferase complex dimerization subunit type 1 TsaB [Clostridia bacterium]